MAQAWTAAKVYAVIDSSNPEFVSWALPASQQVDLPDLKLTHFKLSASGHVQIRHLISESKRIQPSGNNRRQGCRARSRADDEDGNQRFRRSSERESTSHISVAG